MIHYKIWEHSIGAPPTPPLVMGRGLIIYQRWFFVCGMMENFEYPALFGTRDISFNIKLTTKAMFCSDFIP